MKFSVLLSVYNKESPENLTAALNSVFQQTRQPDEVILIEDGELTPALREVITLFRNRYPGIFNNIPLPRNMGLGEALRIGVNSCSYEIIARMDTDDIAKADRFEKQVGFLEQEKDIDIVGSWIDEFTHSTEEILSVRKVPQYADEISSYAKFRSPFNHPSVVFRKSTILECGNYYSYGTFEDYHLWARLIAAKKRGYNFQESLLYFRINESSFKRRGGWPKTVAEYKLQKFLLSKNIINRTEFCRNIVLRGAGRLIPNFLRAFFYKKVLNK